LKADKSTAFERNELRRLLIRSEAEEEQAPKGLWQQLVSTPYMLPIAEHNRYKHKEDVSEENIIRTKRWLVILGDPGSGKTSFARWLVHHLAQTLLLNEQHSTDYGPLRIPILVRIGEFAELLEEEPSLTLFDYMGKHKWMGKAIVDDSSILLDGLSCALQDYIKHGQALIILDGLDEIPVSDQRSLIINAIENFADTYVQTPTDVATFDNAYLGRLLDDPSRSGGNQLIVTSRIVGYHAAPLAGQFVPYTIQPLDVEHMKNFIDYWFFHVHQQMLDTFRLPLINQGENHGEALKKELEKPENVGLLDVASNPSLISLICRMSFNQLDGSPLPAQRIHLYEQIVNEMLNSWNSRASTIPTPKLIRMLSDIAFYIYKYSASNVIDQEELNDACFQSVKTFKSKILLTPEDIQAMESQASEFARIIREDIGILAIRGQSLYGFLHGLFQQYFACLKLIEVDSPYRRIKRTTFKLPFDHCDNIPMILDFESPLH
jgi:predicted NACHT family NTPase